jgi:hypothetical protein
VGSGHLDAGSALQRPQPTTEPKALKFGFKDLYVAVLPSYRAQLSSNQIAGLFAAGRVRPLSSGLDLMLRWGSKRVAYANQAANDLGTAKDEAAA